MTNSIFPHAVRTEFKLLALLRKDNPGISNVECAKQLGVNQNTIRVWLQKPLYQSYENWFLTQTYESQVLSEKRQRSEVKEDLDEFAVEMLGRLKDIVETSNDDKLIVSIGFDMLDRAGYAEPKRDQARAIQFLMTPELINMLQQRAKEISSGEVIVGEVMSG